jgi:hypothetical protein
MVNYRSSTQDQAKLKIHMNLVNSRTSFKFHANSNKST